MARKTRPIMKPTRKWWITLSVLVVIATSLSLLPRTVAVTANPSKELQNAPIITSKISTYEAEVKAIPDLYNACSCESSGKVGLKPKQFNADGTVVTRNNTNGSVDSGACQINSIHTSLVQKLVLDYIHSREDNFAMALAIYKQQGISAWKWSYDPTTKVCRWDE